MKKLSVVFVLVLILVSGTRFLLEADPASKGVLPDVKTSESTDTDFANQDDPARMVERKVSIHRRRLRRCRSRPFRLPVGVWMVR